MTDFCSYFRPKHIEGIGDVQDDGILQNSPLTMALSEFHAVYPDVSQPQFLINLGTGTARSPERHQENRRRALFRNNFIARAFRSYMKLLSGQRPWEDFRRSVKSSSVKDRFFRLDVIFEGPEPRLDDVTVIPELKDLVLSDQSLYQAIGEIARRIIAALFYFELEAIPEQNNGEFKGVGHIFCFRKRSDPALTALVDKLSRSSATFVLNGVKVPGSITDPSFWDADGNFQKRIPFKVNGEISISLREEGSQDYPISGAPFTVEKLVAAQGLNSHFGTADHKRKRECTDERRVETKRRKLFRGRC